MIECVETPFRDGGLTDWPSFRLRGICTSFKGEHACVCASVSDVSVLSRVECFQHKLSLRIGIQKLFLNFYILVFLNKVTKYNCLYFCKSNYLCETL